MKGIVDGLIAHDEKVASYLHNPIQDQLSAKPYPIYDQNDQF